MSDDYNASELLQRVKQGLEEMDQSFAEESDSPCLRMMLNDSNGFFPCMLLVWPDYPIIGVYTQLQCRVPEEKRLEMADFLNRVNSNGWHGNFEMDAESGNLRYRTSLNLADGVLTTHMLAALLYGNASAMNRFLPGIMSLIWNDVAAEDAIGFCEDLDGNADEEAA
jgi:hypothetical protein